MIEVGAVPGSMSELPAEPKAVSQDVGPQLRTRRRRSSAT